MNTGQHNDLTVNKLPNDTEVTQNLVRNRITTINKEPQRIINKDHNDTMGEQTHFPQLHLYIIAINNLPSLKQ